MKKNISYFVLLLLLALIVITHSGLSQKQINPGTFTDTLYTVSHGEGISIEFHFEKGKEHNHPLMAIWIEDSIGNYIQTLYVSKSIAKGIFEHGENSSGKWLPGELRRPAALPVWAHRRNIRENDGLFIPTVQTPIADAYTGATPQNNFVINSHLEKSEIKTFIIFFEINQSWDWNDYWTNNKYPGDEEYKTSCQPSLIYYAKVKTAEVDKEIELNLIGHGHYSGENGEIYTDISTMTTAIEITKRVFALVHNR